MGGGQQANPAMDTLAQQQQQQQWKDIGNTLSAGFQRAGQSVAGANAGLSGQVAQAPSAGDYAQQPQTGPSYGATGQLFAQQGMGGGINEQQLAQILRALGYGG